MLRINNVSQVSQQRTLRALYAQTQGTPYAAYLDTVIYNTTAATATPFAKGSGSTPGTAGQGPIFAGQCAAWGATGEIVHVDVGGNAFAPAGLFANMIGGDFDEIFEFTEVGVWYGPGSVWEILSPAFNSNIDAADEATGADRLLYADANGKLNDTAVSSGVAYARLMDWVSASKIVVMLLV
jgi:hypothetical protein